MRGCLTLLVIVGSVGVAFAMVGASFLYCLVLAVVWMFLVITSKVFGKRKEEDAEESVPE